MRFFYLPVFVAFMILSVMSLAKNNDNKVLIRIEDREITKSEFMDIYRKNNLESSVAEPKEVDEYLEMYIDFRLKVKAAKDQGMDTVSSFVDELQGYREQLAQKYLVDNEVTDQLIEEAWERSQYDLRVSHILLNLPEYAPPEDTLEVYEQMWEIRERILEGESFADMAREHSDDPSAQDRAASGNQPARRGNAGDLGYFTVFNMVYPFETAAYNTEPGNISKPFRSSFGYHIVKVHNRLPAMGQARVAHIMLMTPEGTPDEELEAKEKQIRELHHALIEENADFDELAAEYSEDRQSAQRGGEMPPFTSNRMVPQFIEAINEMEEEGEISQPVRTDFGWHIIKLLEKDSPPPFEEAYTDLQNRIQRDNRSQLSQEIVIDRLKQEYDFRQDEEALRALFDVVDESIFQGQWDSANAADMDDFIFGFAEKNYTQADFADFIERNQRVQNPGSVSGLLYRYYEQMTKEEILAYEDENLEKNYPEFREVMQEYHDGILLFEITNQKVWSKATADTTGLKTYFNEHEGRYASDDLSEVRGTVIADYQRYLEKEWLKKLRRKYDIWINEELLESTLDEQRSQSE